MVLGMGMRTIWISLRAMNYTDRAFRQAIGNLDNLSKKEKQHLKNALAMHEVSRMQIQVGMLQAAMLSMVAGQLWQFMQLTESGSEYLEGFKEIIDEVKVAFADTFFETLKPVLDVVKGFMQVLADNEPLRQVVVLMSLALMSIMALRAGYTLLHGTVGWLISRMTLENYVRAKGIGIKFKDAMANLALSASARSLAINLALVAGASMVAFGLFFALKDVMGPLGAALISLAAVFAILAIKMWLAAGALSVLTFGAAAIAGGLAIAGMLVALNEQLKGFQMGTRSLPYTGLFMGHKGEVVYNPATERPTGVAKELEGEPARTEMDVDINIDNLHVKSDFDDFDLRMRRKLRDLVRGKS